MCHIYHDRILLCFIVLQIQYKRAYPVFFIFNCNICTVILNELDTDFQDVVDNAYEVMSGEIIVPEADPFSRCNITNKKIRNMRNIISQSKRGMRFKYIKNGVIVKFEENLTYYKLLIMCMYRQRREIPQIFETVNE